MKRLILSALACSALIAAGLSIPRLSQASPNAGPTPVPVGHPNFSSMRFMLGTWTCHSRLRGKDRPDTSTTTIGMDGEYMVTHDNAPVFDKFRNRAVNTDSFMTYNSMSGQWVTVSVDNFGGYSVATSPGWRGNTMVSTTTMTQDGSSVTGKTIKISDSGTRNILITKSPNGTVTTDSATCHKSS